MARVAVVGGSLTGNKGAASMVLAVIDGVRDPAGDADVVVLSPLASGEQEPAAAEGVEVVGFGPVEIILACLAAVVCRLTGGRVALTRSTRALADSDVVADVSGIAFVDGRGFVTLVYNVLLVLPAVVIGRPVVKVAQATGPYETTLNRLAARVTLPRMAAVLARGARTQAHLESIGMGEDGIAADVAFLMRTTEADGAWAQAEVGDASFVAVSPSQVVADQARPLGMDYVGHVVAILDDLTTDHDVVLVAHSARPGQPASRLNDVPLCEEILTRVQRPDRCRLAPTDATPRQLRALIARSDILVASRFHAMISGLATATPVLVVGWSHKYREVLDEFDLGRLASDFRELDPAALAAQARALLDERDTVARQIEDGLPTVLASASRNLDILISQPHRSRR